MPLNNYNSSKEKLSTALSPIYRETWFIGFFTLLHLFIGPNRLYLVALLIFIIILYRLSGSLIEALWLSFLAALPFGRGRYFEHVVIYKSNWVGDWDLTFNIAILFSDLILAAIIYLLITRFKNKGKKHAKDLLYLFLSIALLLVSSAFSTYFARFPDSSFYFYIQLVKFVLLFFVSLAVFVNRPVVGKTLQALGLFTVFNALLVVAQYINRGPLGLSVEGSGPLYGFFAFENPELYRPGGITADPNIAASFLATILPIFLISTLVTNKKRTHYYWVVLTIVSVALVLTASRAAWLVSLVSSAVAIFISRRLYKTYFPEYLRRYLRVIVLVLIILFAPIIVGRLATISDIFNKEGGGTYRLNHIKIGWQYVISKPFGVGIGLFPFAVAQDFPMNETGLRPTLAHNIFAQIGAETGFIGLVSFLLFLWLISRKPINSILKKRYKHNPISLGIFLSFISLVLLNLVFPWFLHPSIGWMFWILGACIYSVAV